MASGTSNLGPPEAVAPIVILVEPQLGENIGTAARAMANFALSELRLVAPRDGWPNAKAVSAASGADAIVAGARVYATLPEAVADLHYVLATSARRRDMVKPVFAPEAAAAALHERIAAGERVGVLFGREKWGLTNEDVAAANGLVMAPVNPAFASLNLAQAVLIVGYEWYKRQGQRRLGRETAEEAPGREGLQMATTRPATHAELDGFFGHLEAELDRAGFLRPPDKRPRMVRNLRNLFLRIGLTEQDVRTLRGIITALARPRGREET